MNITKINTNKIIFIVNPNSGNNNHVSNLFNFLKNTYRKNNYDIIVTKNIDDIYSVDLNCYNFIVFVGGDGTISSFIQDNLNVNQSIGCIPSGSGNGFVNSLLYDKYNNMESIIITNELINKNLAFAINYNNTKLIDTIKIDFLETKKEITSFLFISCGIFSNIDLNTDYLRWLGSFRFILGAIYELFKYIFYDNIIRAHLEYNDENNNTITINDDFVFFMAHNMSHTSSFSITSPYSKPDDGYIYLSYIIKPVSIFCLLTILLGLDDGSYINKLTYVKVKNFSFNPKNGIYDIDGEKYDIEPIDAKITPSSMRVLY